MTIIATVLTVATNQVRSIERRGGKLQNREIASATYTKPCGTGTSACSGIATLAEASFFCSNQGRYTAADGSGGGAQLGGARMDFVRNFRSLSRAVLRCPNPPDENPMLSP